MTKNPLVLELALVSVLTISSVNTASAKAKNSAIEGKGVITVCTNWVWLSPTDGTFFSQLTVTGSAAAAD